VRDEAAAEARDWAARGWVLAEDAAAWVEEPAVVAELVALTEASDLMGLADLMGLVGCARSERWAG